jgi:hypothetical protein
MRPSKRSSAAATRRDLPIPGSPVMETIGAASREQAVEDPAQRGEFHSASNERRLGVRGGLRADPRDTEGDDRLALAFQLEVSERLQVEPCGDLMRGRRSHHQLAQRLQASSHIDGVAEGVVEHVWRCIASGHDHGTGVDGDARIALQPVGWCDLRGVGLQRFADRERGADSPLGVVLVREGRTEEREDAVAGELCDSAAEPFDLFTHQAHDVVEEELGAFRAKGLGDRRRPDDIGDQHRHDSPLSNRHRHVRVIRLVGDPGRAEEAQRGARGAAPADLSRSSARGAGRGPLAAGDR